MVKKGYIPEQIINKLCEAEILLNQGDTITVISRKIGISDHTYYRWLKHGLEENRNGKNAPATVSGKRKEVYRRCSVEGT